MYGCEIIFDAETAASIRQQLDEKMGDDAPCRRCLTGLKCPLLPDDLTPLLIAGPALVSLVPGC